jgi:hypothetical protein
MNHFDALLWATDRIMEASDVSQEDQEMEVSSERTEIQLRRASMGNREMAKDGLPRTVSGF